MDHDTFLKKLEDYVVRGIPNRLLRTYPIDFRAYHSLFYLETISPVLDSVSQGSNLNYFHNIIRLFDVLPNFSFTTSETKSDY